MKNNIVLCGFMGSGKSTVGKCLAKKLNFTLADSDALIEKCESMVIRDIFAHCGEEYFRNVESYIIGDLSKQSELIIATGGGAVLNQKNAESLRKNGLVIFLDVTPETVLERLKHDTTRPLLQRADKELAIKQLMEERRPKYEVAAHHTIDANRTAEEIADDIITLYNS